VQKIANPNRAEKFGVERNYVPLATERKIEANRFDFVLGNERYKEGMDTPEINLYFDFF
jgi:hypothetical protein